MKPADPYDAVVPLVRVFERLRVPYVVGGALASALHGIPRATLDADMVAALPDALVTPFVDAIEETFYVDAAAVREAIRLRSSFNVVQIETQMKVDVFVAKGDEWSREEFRRSIVEPFEAEDGRIEIRYASPEDTILHKLVWYRKGEGISDRQWNDLLGILKILGRTLDWAYLARWAAALGVEELLAKAERDAAP